jgi:predicted methyltransferase
MNKILLALLLVMVIFPTQAAEDFSALKNAINGKHRSAEHKARDKYRHPFETLEFFDVKNNMSVIEVWPGKEGWYTEILAPYLKRHGHLITAHFSKEAVDEYAKKSRHQFVTKLHKSPKIYDKIKLTVLQPPQFLQIAPDGWADRILTFRNVHNWMKNDQAPAVFKAMFNALKPGGILGVVEHRSSTSKPQDTKALSGYVSEDYVIALARNAGFEFLAKSEINANTKDSKDYPEGVWTLPPTLKLKDKDRKKYLDIGESDRMTIKFIKPK